MTAIVPDQGPRAYNTVQQGTATIVPFDFVVAKPLFGLKHLTFYFDDADDNELFLTPPGTIACAWQANAVTSLTTATVGSTGILFDSAANSAGWLHILCRGTLKVGSSTIDAPVARGTAGHVQPERTMYLNHKSATPNTLTTGKHVNKKGLKLQIFPFATTADNDTWECTTAGLCPGIVAVAWQANDAAEDVIATLNASGDVKFNSTAGSAEYGWLWAWRR